MHCFRAITNKEFTSRVHVCESRHHPVFNQSLGGFICIICSHTRIAVAFAIWSTPDFRWQGCSNVGKNQNPKKFLDQNLTPKKSHAEIPSHKKFQKALNAITRKIEILVLNTQKNPYLNQATQKITCQNFPTPKKSRNREFQTQNNPSIIPVTWNSEHPPPPPSMRHLPAGIFLYCLPLGKNNNAVNFLESLK